MQPAKAERSSHAILLFIIIVLCMIRHSIPQDFFITASPTNISQLANYSIIASSFSGYDIPANSILMVSFPPEYNTTYLHNATSYSGGLASDYCIDSCSLVTVTFSGNSFALANLFNSDIASGDIIDFKYTIFNIKNPSVANPSAFSITIFKGSTIYYPLGGSSSVSGPTFITRTVTYTTQVVYPTIWGVSPLKFTITPNNVIDTIRITFPTGKWNGEVQSSLNAVIGGSSCTSSTNPTITCSFTSPTFTITNLYYYTSLVPIEITINSISNPSSCMPAGGITIQLLLNNSILQQSTSLSLPASSFTNDILRKTSSSLTYQPNDKINIELDFQFAEFNNNTDRIFITFPSQLTLPLSSSNYSLSMAGSTSTPTLSFNSSTNTVAFNVQTNSTYQIAVTVNVSGLSRPRQCKTISNFSIKTYRSGLYLMDSTTCCSIQLANRQTLTINSITLSNSHNLQTSTYTFNFSTSVVNLIPTDSIQIMFPPQYASLINSANNSTFCPSLTITSINFPAQIKTPTCNMYLNYIILSSFLLSNLSGSETFIVKLFNVTNPSKTSTTGFGITTLSTANYVLEQALNFSITIQPNTLSNFTISASPSQTCATNALYTFTFINNSPLLNGYKILIYFPSDFTFINFNTMQCNINSVAYQCSRKNSTFGTSTITVLININSTITTLTSLTISSVTNPISMAPTGSFSAEIWGSSGQLVEATSGSYPISMTTTSSFTLFTVTAANFSLNSTSLQSSIQYFNSSTNSLWLTMAIPFTPLVTPSSLLISFLNSSKVQYSGTSICSSSQIISSCTISTNNSTANMEVLYPSLSFSSLNTNFIQVQVKNLFVIDYFNLQILATLSINGFSSLSLTTPAKISKIYAQAISNYSVSLSNQILGQSSSATLTIICSSQTASQLANIVVYVPQEFGSSSYTINFSSANFSSNQLTISGLTNPTAQAYTPFLFSILNSNGDIIAFSAPTNSSKVYSFILACSLPCKTCSNLTICNDCYTSISWIPQIYFNSSANTCVTRCLEGQYLSGSTCSSCDSNCLTCLMYGSGFSNGNSTYCLSCNASNYLYGSACQSSCPSGYYPSMSICEPCMSNCLNCTSSSTCSSCQSSYSLYNNSKCIYTCPSSTVSVTNTTTSQAKCVNCPTNCISCSSAALPLCLNCANGFYLYNGGCVSNCSSLSLYISYQMSCTACQCLTCSNYAFNCTSCANPYNLYQNQCLLNCPNGYYSSSNICVACFTNCLSCTSSTNCLYCLIPYALYVINSTTSTCNLACPNNTIATINASSLKYVCQSCGGFCKTCQTSVTYCLSCITGYILNNNTCVAACPSGFWLIGGVCRVCSPICQSCSVSDPYNCSSCAPNYYYFNNSCNTSCSIGTYADVSTLICKPCNVVCSACTNSTNCTSCANGYYLYNSFCYNNCSSINSLYYSYNGSCLICQPQCTACLTTPFQCTSCSSSSYYFNPVDKSCSLNCTAPYYINGSYCSPCQAPCSTCDTLYNSCLTCIGNLSVWNGQCNSTCPSGYYSLNNVCTQCSSACLTCTALKCLTCQTYAYRYMSTCVFDCSATSLPITVDTYCTSCAEVPYCQTCQTSASNTYVCFVCIYPYVIFQGNCLNECPNLYAIDNSSNTCVPTSQYSAYLNQLYIDNYPYFPPFCFFALLVIIGAFLVYNSHKNYRYSYHFGYLIALSTMLQLCFLAYGFRYLLNLYQGDYKKQDKFIPIFVLGASFAFKLLLNTLYVIIVLGSYYLQDVRFKEWKQDHQAGFRLSIVLSILFGCRFYKLYYSKFMGKSLFSYRVISVQKFYYQDMFVWISILPDIADLSAFVIVNYNIFITYAVLYLFSFELLLFKLAQWIMLAYDLKKPDRGFFLGDEEEAERMIKQQNQQKEKEKRKVEMESLVKLIRSRSAGNFQVQKLYQHLFIDDYRSVFDPKDYEDVPVVPKKKIQKYINKGKFRKGKKITMEEKLKRFAQSIKPTPVVSKDDSYLNGLIYWKPPKQLKVKKKEPNSQESMLKLLEDKQLQYQDLSSIQVIDLDHQSGVEHDERASRFRRGKRTGFGVDDETVIDTYDQIYDPSSLQFIEVEEENDYNGLWNKNYAIKQHLPKTKQQARFDDNGLRVFHHQPLKKRRSKLNEIRSRHY